MNKYKTLVLLAFVLFLPSTGLAQTTYFKSNSVYDIWMNQHNVPVITRLDVTGNVVVPWDNPGAQFQMTARSTAGNAWNPTQAGDCRRNKSTLTGVTRNWNAGIGISSSNGIQLRVDPLLYDEDGLPPNSCTASATGTIAPVDFKFGFTLGDAISLPEQVMVLDMEVRRESGAQNIHPIQSEFPAIFPSNYSLKYAYYSTDGVNFSSWLYNGTNNIQSWGKPDPAPTRRAKAIMLHTHPDANATPDSGMGIVIYTNDTVEMVMSRRTGARFNLGYMAATGSGNASETITDTNWHKWRRIVVVGNLNTIKNSIRQAKSHLGSGSWHW